MFCSNLNTLYYSKFESQIQYYPKIMAAGRTRNAEVMESLLGIYNILKSIY